MTEHPTIIPHSKPLLGAEEAQAVAAVIASGQVAEGPETAAFERELAGRLGCAHAVAVSSGTAALHLALAAMGVGAGDEVVVPSFVCAALFHAVAATGAVPVPADIDPLTLNLDPGDARRRLSARTRALVLPHLFGRVADPAPFLEMGVPLVEDCAHTLGARVDGRPAGSFGHVAVTSSYATKLIATGEGGAVATASEPLAAAVRDLKQYDRRPLDRARYNLKFTDLQAAVGRAQLRRLDAFIRRRRAIAACYRERPRPAPRRREGPGRAHLLPLCPRCRDGRGGAHPPGGAGRHRLRATRAHPAAPADGAQRLPGDRRHLAPCRLHPHLPGADRLRGGAGHRRAHGLAITPCDSSDAGLLL